MTKMIKGLQVGLAKTLLRAVTRMKGNMIREVVQQPIAWACFRIK